MNDLTIRLETPKDYRAIEELTREAFWNVYTRKCACNSCSNSYKNKFTKRAAKI